VAWFGVQAFSAGGGSGIREKTLRISPPAGGRRAGIGGCCVPRRRRDLLPAFAGVAHPRQQPFRIGVEVVGREEGPVGRRYVDALGRVAAARGR
jgi:hypothetical protein